MNVVTVSVTTCGKKENEKRKFKYQVMKKKEAVATTRRIENDYTEKRMKT